MDAKKFYVNVVSYLIHMGSKPMWVTKVVPCGTIIKLSVGWWGL
jgi:hypothetical protein